MTLSMLLSAYFLVEGVAKIVEYFRVRAVSGSVWLLVLGTLSALLAFIMWSNIIRGASMIGIILGVNFIVSGIAFLILGRKNCSKL